MKKLDNDPRHWEILKSDYLFRRPWLTARRDCVRLPAGVVNDEYYVLEYPDWVNVIARTKTGEFVFIRQYRHGLGQTAGRSKHVLGLFKDYKQYGRDSPI